ncbi:MAG: ribonuclease H [uncultured bacterium (gcode 4)]|uniref:Ribonuclease H n=1 Tax=uncultured bacterium (gcode 4) TaxID=1234023 RepID=K2GHK6_9BACT|nr:MAG: ribonuclease H [uncultured bacterium (gcode 4)]
MNLRVYTDGWARWNPWSAWLWVFITDTSWSPVEKRYKSLWVKTNNQAEYLGAYNWIERAIGLWATEIELYMDSELIVKQLKWEYKTKNPELKEIQKEIQDMLLKWWWKLTVTHIRREQNKEADRLSNIAMDKNDL